MSISLINLLITTFSYPSFSCSILYYDFFLHILKAVFSSTNLGNIYERQKKRKYDVNDTTMKAEMYYVPAHQMNRFFSYSLFVKS